MKKGLLKNKDFLLLAQGQFFSNIGTAIHMVAVTWYILELVEKSRSGFVLGAYFVCTSLPLILLGPLAGVYVDRLNRKWIIAGSDLINGFLFILLSLLTYLHFFPLPTLFVISIISSFFFTFFNPAVSASIPNIVHGNDLVKANSITQMTFHISLIVGGAVSGLLYNEIGVEGIFLMNGVSYLISGISESFINIPHTIKKKTGEASHVFKDLIGGIMHVKNDKPILILLIYFLFFCFATQPFFTLIIPKIINYNLNLGATYYGIFQALLSCGGIAGMLFVGYLNKKSINQYVWFISSVTSVSFIIFLFAVPILPFMGKVISNYNIIYIYCGMVFLLELIAATFIIPIWVIFQKRIPNEFRGRFFAIFNTCVLAATPLGNLVFGSLSDLISMYIVVSLLGLFMIAASLILLMFPKLKELY